MSDRFVGKLSDLTPAVVDRLYGTDRAESRADPKFVFLVGAPGVGKSSGHASAIKEGHLPACSAGGYATINLDTLLESLVPFRAASAMGYVATHKPSVKDLVKFSTLSSYGSRQENLGAFKWYNTAHPAIKEADPALADALNGVRERFLPLRGEELPKGSSLMDINEAAIERAVERSVPIIYETTLSLNKKEGRVKKVDEIMDLLAAKGPQYRVVLVHMTAPPEEIAMRIHHRQEFGMPYEEMPFYRYVPADPVDPKAVIAMAKGTAEAVSAIEEQYGGRIEVVPLETVMNASRLTAPRIFDNVALVHRIRNVYGPGGKVSHKKSISNRSSGSHKRRHTKTSSSERRLSVKKGDLLNLSAQRDSDRRRRNAATTHKKRRSGSSGARGGAGGSE
jgi:hypothetical protein